MTTKPSEWVEREARRNPIVAAYLRYGHMTGYGLEWLDMLAMELAAANALLTEQLAKALTEAPPPIVIKELK